MRAEKVAERAAAKHAAAAAQRARKEARDAADKVKRKVRVTARRKEAAAAEQANKATTRGAAKKAQAELNQAKHELCVRRRVLEGIKRPRQLLKPIKPPQPLCASQQNARMLIQIRKYKNTAKPTKDQPCSPQQSRSISWYRL